MAPQPWVWDPAPDLYPLVDRAVTHGEDHYVLGHRPVPVPVPGACRKAPTPRLARVRGDGTELWAVTPPIGADDLAGAAVAVDGERVFIAHYHRAASGCRLDAFAADDGRALWSVRLRGAGAVGHSAYTNRVQLALVDGDPVVFGHESAGRYVERRDAATGALRSHRALPAEPLPLPVAEPLFYELTVVLARRRRYRVAVNDFLERHVLTDVYPEGPSRRQAMRDAVTYLDGMPLHGGRYVLAVELVDDARGLRLRARRHSPRP